MKIVIYQKSRYCTMAIVIEFHKLIFFHLSHMVTISHNFKARISLLWHSHSTISKFYQPFTMKFFQIGNPSFYFFIIIFLDISRNHIMSIMSIVIIIFSNITVLVSQNIISFGFFITMSHGINNKTPPSASPYLPLPYQVFTRFVCCFTRNA